MKGLSSFLAPLFVTLAPAAVLAAPQKLLLTEVTVAPSEAEHVAIYNPGSAPVDLTNYYLSDTNFYYKVVTSTAPGGASDFIARFPAGAQIGPGETQYVAIGGAECFKSACGTMGGVFTGFGVYPTYEIPSTVDANNSSAVPDMIAPFTDAIGAGHNLTNLGEPVVLFYWDGNSSLVTDIDYVCYGSPTFGNPAVQKTDQTTITGPSGTPGTYQNDSADAASHHAPLSAGGVTINTCRVMPYSEGTQVMSGGNGIDGSDETSENSATTWTACMTVALGSGSSSTSSSSTSASSSSTSSSGISSSSSGASSSSSSSGLGSSSSNTAASSSSTSGAQGTGGAGAGGDITHGLGGSGGSSSGDASSHGGCSFAAEEAQPGWLVAALALAAARFARRRRTK